MDVAALLIKYGIYFVVGLLGFFIREIIKSLKNSIKELGTKADTLEDKVTEAKTKIDYLQKQIDEEKSRVQSIEKTLNKR